MKLKLSRQYLEDLSNYFIPFILRVVEARIHENVGTDSALLDIICRSTMETIDVMFKKKLLTDQQKFKLKFTEAEGIIFMKLLLQFPIPADHFWRNNLRNQIVEQLDKQLV